MHRREGGGKDIHCSAQNIAQLIYYEISFKFPFNGNKELVKYFKYIKHTDEEYDMMPTIFLNIFNAIKLSILKFTLLSILDFCKLSQQ